jgi:hypothetical protein
MTRRRISRWPGARGLRPRGYSSRVNSPSRWSILPCRDRACRPGRSRAGVRFTSRPVPRGDRPHHGHPPPRFNQPTLPRAAAAMMSGAALSVECVNDREIAELHHVLLSRHAVDLGPAPTTLVCPLRVVLRYRAPGYVAWKPEFPQEAKDAPVLIRPQRLVFAAFHNAGPRLPIGRSRTSADTSAALVGSGWLRCSDYIRRTNAESGVPVAVTAARSGGTGRVGPQRDLRPLALCCIVSQCRCRTIPPPPSQRTRRAWAPARRPRREAGCGDTGHASAAPSAHSWSNAASCARE